MAAPQSRPPSGPLPFIGSEPFSTKGGDGLLLPPATVWVTPAIFVPVRESLSVPKNGESNTSATTETTGTTTEATTEQTTEKTTEKTAEKTTETTTEATTIAPEPTTGKADNTTDPAPTSEAPATLPTVLPPAVPAALLTPTTARPPSRWPETRTERLERIIATHEAHARSVRGNLTAMYRQRERAIVDAYRAWERAVLAREGEEDEEDEEPLSSSRSRQQRRRGRQGSAGGGAADANSDQAMASTSAGASSAVESKAAQAFPLRQWESLPELTPVEERWVLDSLKAPIPPPPLSPMATAAPDQPRDQPPGLEPIGAAGTATAPSTDTGQGAGGKGVTGGGGQQSASQYLADYDGPRTYNASVEPGAPPVLERMVQDIVPPAVLAGEAGVNVTPRHWLALARLRLIMGARDQLDGYSKHAKETLKKYQDALKREMVRDMMFET